MTSPRYTPAGFLVDPSEFGETERPRWTGERLTGYRLDQLNAARMQHHLAWRMRSAIRAQHGTEVAYAAVADISVSRLRRLLKGEIVMRLEDLALVRRTLGIS